MANSSHSSGHHQDDRWLRGAGFNDVQSFWQHDNRAVFGGLKKA